MAQNQTFGWHAVKWKSCDKGPQGKDSKSVKQTDKKSHWYLKAQLKTLLNQNNKKPLMSKMVSLWISGSFCCNQFGFRALNFLMCFNSNLYASSPILLLLFLYYELCISINKTTLFSQEHVFNTVWGQGSSRMCLIHKPCSCHPIVVHVCLKQIPWACI